MDCQDIIQIPVVREAIANPKETMLLDRIFNCIYKLFCADFINWIIAKNPGFNINIVREMATDAFQEGLIVFLTKTKEKGLAQKASLRTIIFIFGYWQFMALKKKYLKKKTVSFDQTADSLNHKDSLTLAEIICEGNAYWDETFKMVLSEDEYKLHKAISRLQDNWRKILYWLYFDELKPIEIAQRMNVGIEHVYNMLAKARRELREILIVEFNFLK